MCFAIGRSLISAIAGFVAVAALACSSGTPSSTQVPAAELSEESTPRLYDPNGMMYRLFPGFFLKSDLQALEEVEQRMDVSQVVVLVEVLRFPLPPRSRRAFAATLRELTGQSFGGDDWSEWVEWLGKHRADFPPPEEYAAWKANLLSQIDPRFGLFLRTAKETSRIDLTEVVWGGVIPDGIPDLRNPPILFPEEADYLGPGERVFGVSINGEHRAYPLRITNPHEMVNDVLGGEPISLAW